MFKFYTTNTGDVVSRNTLFWSFFFLSVLYTFFKSIPVLSEGKADFQFRPIRAKKQLKLLNYIHEKGLIRPALTLYDLDLFATQARILSVTA